jgi:hypothetical protein
LATLLREAAPGLHVAARGALGPEQVRALVAGQGATAFLGPADAARLVDKLERHHAGQHQRLVSAGEQPGQGHFFMMCHPHQRADFTSEPPSLHGTGLMSSNLIVLYFPVAELGWEAPGGGRWCHTLIQVYGMLAPLLERVAAELGRSVYVPIMDAVPCVASAVPESGQERQWDACRRASFAFVEELLRAMPTLQLAVLSTKVHRELRKHCGEDLFGGDLGAAGPVGHVERALGDELGSVTSAFALPINSGTHTNSLALFASHPAAKLTVAERTVMGLALGLVAVRASVEGASEPQGLHALCADLLDAEALGHAVRVVEEALQTLSVEDADAYMGLLRSYRDGPAELMGRLEERLGSYRDGPRSEVLALLLRASGIVIGALTSERARVAASVVAQLRLQQTPLSLRDIIGLVEEGRDSDGLGDLMLLHPDSTRGHLAKSIKDMLQTVKGWDSFVKHSALRATPARLEYFLLGLLIDTHNGSIGGAWVLRCVLCASESLLRSCLSTQSHSPRRHEHPPMPDESHPPAPPSPLSSH